MDDIIQILFLGITLFSVVYQLFSAKEKKKPASSAPTVLTEPFSVDPVDDCPVEEPFGKEQEIQPIDPEAIKCSHNNHQTHSMAYTEIHCPPVPEKQVPCSSRQNQKQKQNQAGLSLHNHQEARRAFLASEIFHRKYE